MNELATDNNGLNGRSTQEVLYDHLRMRKDRQIEEDIETNYALDVVIYSSSGILRGQDGLRELIGLFQDQLPKPSFTYETILVENDIGFLEWTATSERDTIAHGSETYLIHNGQIVAQTVHFSIVDNPDE